MKIQVKLGVTLGVVAALLGTSGISAAASRQYSAYRSNGVKLIWRSNMKAQTYTTAKGTLYSKHLGYRNTYGSQLTQQTVITDKHEKLYRKAKGNSAIYYHVTSADGQLSGWIWRGYLTKSTATSNQQTTTKAQPTASNFVVSRTLQKGPTQSDQFETLVTNQMTRDGFSAGRDLSRAYTDAEAQTDDWTGQVFPSFFADNWDSYDEITGKLTPKDIHYIYSAANGTVGNNQSAPNLTGWNVATMARVLHTTNIDSTTGNTGTLVQDFATYLENILKAHQAKTFFITTGIGYPGRVEAGSGVDGQLSLEFTFLYTQVPDGKN